MKRIKNLVIGGIETKLFNLILITVLVLSAAFLAVTLIHGRMLNQLTEETGQRQREAIGQNTGMVMDAVVEKSMGESLVLRASVSDEMFSDLADRVEMLAACTEKALSDPAASPAPYAAPDPARDGETYAQMILADGVDESAIADKLGIVAGMSWMMQAMYDSSEEVSSCFIGLPEGAFLITDDRSGQKFDADGSPIGYDPRTRFWYDLAVENRGLVFTDVEEDAFTGDVGIVCAMPVYVDGRLAAVVGSDLFLTGMRDSVEASEADGSFLCVVNHNGHVVFSPRETGVLKVMPSADAWDLRENANEALARLVTDAMTGPTGVREVKLVDGWYYMMGTPLDTVGWVLLSAVSRDAAAEPVRLLEEGYSQIEREAVESYRTRSAGSNTAIAVLTAVLLLAALAVALVMGRRIVRPLNTITNRISQLREGDLEFKMEDAYRTGDEIEVLAESFADLSHKTVEYVQHVQTVTAEKERIGTELEMATRIQSAMMPHVFPAFPGRSEFDICATMDPAREVGGDFYDFFLVDDDRLCMVMADVSGKGVPAALFMMACKIILQSVAMLGGSPAEILTRTNQAICSNNQEEMFITVWLGILELSTGKLTAANAGHEYPVIMEPDGRFELYRDKHGLVVGAMDGVKYRDYEMTLKPGARLFVYTDGVPEAANAEKEMFGLTRMVTALNKVRTGTPEEILAGVSRDVNRFVMGAEQFDDITMLCLEYKGNGGEEHE
ncbi:MAG: SpoIIE family protein phosphatase [Oscillospiraceae bacterium]|nr:SpoIIE family protein phosphatase [Oscillospiraceae bacterium]